MKVNDTVRNIVIPKRVSQPEALVGSVGGAGGAGGSDGPRKSSTTIYQKMEEAIRAEPEVRNELVLKYKELIKSGEYKNSPEKISSKMISESINEEIS